jgi:hypothetical protein
MTSPKKPEWFELTQTDRIDPRSSFKASARGVLLALPLLLIGAGIVVAQGTDETPSVAESITTLASDAPQVSTAASTSAIKSSSVQQIQPTIAIPPTGGGDDEDENDEEEEED